MSTAIAERMALHQAIDRLPDEALSDLADIVQRLVLKYQSEEEKPPFKPVYFPEGISKGDDVSPEAIREMRREVWANFPRDLS